jgi:hypothetical protein
MKAILLILFSISTLSAQTLRYDTDTISTQDSFKLYYNVKLDDSIEIPIAIYKYNYTIRERKSHIKKAYNLDSTVLLVDIEPNVVVISVEKKKGPSTFMLVIWMRKKYYVLYFDNYKLTKLIT